MSNDISSRVAFLAEGKLYMKNGASEPVLVNSTFAQEIVDRLNRTRQRNDWKQQSMGWNLGLGRLRGMPGAAPAAETRRIQFTGVSMGADNELFYVMDTDYVGGLFAQDIAEGIERRLFHRNQFRARDLSRNPGNGRLALTVHADDHTSHIAIMEEQGRGLREITEGDCLDEAPRWVNGENETLVFQSAGIGRDARGFRNTLGPYMIQKLELDRDRMTTLLESETEDYLLPLLTKDGTLYCIRRPYEANARISWLKVGLDILLFPYRLLVAIIHFLNFFSLMFSRKPLMTAGGPPKEQIDTRYMMIWGKVIDAEKALRSPKSNKDESLVPSSWQLIRRENNGTEKIIAKAVLAFDVAPDGRIVYTNGTRIFLLDADLSSTPREVYRGRFIERVCLL